MVSRRVPTDRPDRCRPAPTSPTSPPGSAGRAVINVETRVVDDRMQDVAMGEVGEIVHRSPHLMQGYFHDDDRTKAAFEGDWFHSGDLGTIDEEGYISVVDRKKDMIKSGGENVASREVEEMIYRLPQVSEVAVIGRKDDEWGEVPVAVVALDEEEGPDLTLEELTEWLRDKLAGYKLPKHLVHVDELPRNASGKVVKGTLRTEHGSVGV